jgi:hypothetical protein
MGENNMEEADVNEAQLENRFHQLEEMAIHIYEIWEDHQFQETITYWLVHEGYYLNHDEDRIVRDFIDQKIRLDAARNHPIQRPERIGKWRAFMQMHILRPKEIYELVNANILTPRQAVIGHQNFLIFLRDVVWIILTGLLCLGLLVWAILEKYTSHFELLLMIGALMGTFWIQTITNIFESFKQLLINPRGDIHNVHIPWNIQAALDRLNQEETNMRNEIARMGQQHIMDQEESPLPESPLQPPPFNLVFREEGEGGNRIRGIPPCFFCTHASPTIEFTANAAFRDLILWCDEERTVLWNGERFYWDALEALCKEDADIPLDIRNHQDCSQFEPNLHVWDDHYAIKTGEFEII